MLSPMPITTSSAPKVLIPSPTRSSQRRDENFRRSAGRDWHWAQHRCRSGTRSGTAPSRARGNALRKRGADSAGARVVCRGQLSRERGGLADRRRARAGHCQSRDARIDPRSIAAGDMRAGPRGLAELGTAAPSDLLLRAADACRAAGAFDCATSLYRRAREAAGRTACGRRGRHRPGGDARAGRQTARSARDVSRTSTHIPRGRRLRACRYRSAPPLVPTRRRRTADRSRLRRHRRSPRRNRGISPRRRHAGRVAEELSRIVRAARKSSRRGFSISIRCAPTTKLACARSTFLKEHPDSADSATSSSRSSGSTCAKGALPTSRSADAPSWAARSPAPTLSDRQGAARLLAEYLVSIGQPAKALGVYSELYKMTPTRSGRVDVLWRMAIASLRAQQSRARGQRAAAGAAPEARFRNRARRVVLAALRAGCRRREGCGPNAMGVAGASAIPSATTARAPRCGAARRCRRRRWHFPSSRCAMRSSRIPTTKRPRCSRAPACCRMRLSTRGG